MNRSTERHGLRCSFCNKAGDGVETLVAGPDVFICDECIRVCVDILLDDGHRAGSAEAVTLRQQASQLRDDHTCCALCGTRALPEELLLVRDRASICGPCADAVEDALSRGSLRTDSGQ